MIKTYMKKILTKKKSKYTKALDISSEILSGQIAYNRYGGYCIPMSSIKRPAVQTILRGKIHEPNTISFMRNNCNSGDIIHAGTFFGDFLPAISLKCKTKIWAFEPNPENYLCTQITIQINNLQNVNLFNCGLGIRKCDTKMLIETENGISLGGASRIINKNKKAGKIIDIHINKIDNIIPQDRQVGILQLDVEGYEKEALAGALETINRCKPILILEDNQKIINTKWFNDKVLSLGYRKQGKVHANTIFINKE